MNYRIGFILAAAFASTASYGVILNAHPGPANNGGSPNWAMFMDFSASGTDLSITSLTTASTAAANAGFNVEVFTRSGTGLGGPVGSGPGSSSAGWTSLGTVGALQGGVANGVSLNIDIPDIFVANGSTVGVALRFTGAGPRYFGTGAPPLSNFTDGTLSLITGDVRSAPFTTGGSFFTSRALVGSVTYSAVPEPATMLVLLGGAAAIVRRRRNKK